ncbi:hypothetical protein [Candidatus Nitronereus thalassa]|uniref:Lipoprotein n=1 Tax=Candidatus Nitronereus thalassa TaxID=3020898 RepID=A0ABU3K8W3_9BACT|nr:hypothetical protein [Candidatus Nitronereus thalassa]MDT7042852.1 hypothetical protein [Candidatus Nitronereus thalassa]
MRESSHKDLKSKGWFLVTACSVLLLASSCAQVRDFYKEKFPNNVTLQDGSHTEAEMNGKAASKEIEQMDKRDSRTTTTSSPFSLKWSW